MSKQRLYKWADAQRRLKPTEKALLRRCVAFANSHGYFWQQNAALAEHLNIQRRQVQKLMRRLEQAELILRTGEWLVRKGARYPIYRLQPPELDEGSDGAHCSSPPPASTGHPTGRPGVHPHREKKREEESSYELSRVLSAYRRALARHPAGGRAHTNPIVARQLWRTTAAIHGPERLDRAHERWVADFAHVPEARGAPSLQTWLQQERYEPYLDTMAAEPHTRTNIPPDVARAFEAHLPGKLSDLRRCQWREADRTLITATAWFAASLKRETDFLATYDLRVEPPR